MVVAGSFFPHSSPFFVKTTDALPEDCGKSAVALAREPIQREIFRIHRIHRS